MSHVRCKVPIGYNGAVQIRPQKYPFPWTDCQTPIPASSLDPSDLWCQTAAGCDLPVFHNALDRQTDRPTDRTRESLMTIGRCAPRATRPNNNNKIQNSGHTWIYREVDIKCNDSHSRSLKVNVYKRYFLIFISKFTRMVSLARELPRSFKVIHNDITTLYKFIHLLTYYSKHTLVIVFQAVTLYSHT